MELSSRLILCENEGSGTFGAISSASSVSGSAFVEKVGVDSRVGVFASASLPLKDIADKLADASAS